MKAGVVLFSRSMTHKNKKNKPTLGYLFIYLFIYQNRRETMKNLHREHRKQQQLYILENYKLKTGV